MKTTIASKVEFWACRCGQVSSSGIRVCRNCGTPRNLASAVPPADESTPAPVDTRTGQKRAVKRQEMNRLESEFLRTELRRLIEVGVLARVQFQPFRLYLANGHSYRPDFAAWETCGAMRVYECKGSYIHSRDSRILFDQAAEEFPEWRFFWARKNPEWEVVEYAK